MSWDEQVRYGKELHEEELSLMERLVLAKAAVIKNGEGDLALWPHQRFAISLNELLDAAIRGA